MIIRIRVSAWLLFALFLLPVTVAIPTQAQQTLGGITGTVTDASGAALPGTTVTLVGDQTTLTRTQTTNDSGSYLFVDLPIGNYTLTFTHDGFDKQNIPSIAVQANRTMTVNAELKVGEINTTVTVEETPLVNAVDTTNGYVLDKAQITAVPLPTGSFTGLAILTPGVNAELSSGTGANSGLGNAPIWANGQRDTSNTFLLNGVDASNLFNGKSTSQVASARIVNNTGIGGAASFFSQPASPIQVSGSPYLAIGESLPTPPPEMIQELRVNASMYDAEQGSTSGAHIDLSTSSGTNEIHGQAYIHRGTNWLNATPFFNKQDTNIPQAYKDPGLHREVPGGTLGGPIIKNKLFAFIAYQHLHVGDADIGDSRIAVPANLTNDRSPAALAIATEATTPTVDCPAPPCSYFTSTVALPATVGTGPGQISPIAYGLLNYKLPNGQFLIPSSDGNLPTFSFPEDAFVPNTAYFLGNMATGNIDYLVSTKDTLALKYYYQHDPTTAPYAYSGFTGFTQHLDAGSQVASISNTQTLTPTFSLVEVFGFIHEKLFSTIGQPFTPAQFATYVEGLTGASPADATINTFGSPYFPGMSISDDYGNNFTFQRNALTGQPYNPNEVSYAGVNLGQGGNSQGAWTGVFENRFMPSADATWNKGKHTITFGGDYEYSQLNVRDERPGKGMIGFPDFSDFLQGLPITYSATGYITTTILQGNANRYYRSPDTGLYAQDKFQFRQNLSLSFGLRFDDHGGMKEKDGELYNFDPALYNYDAATDTIINNGFIVAGNNPDFPTKGVSASTLTGRQWGLAPRIGVAWSPKMFNNKVVVRAGWGMYYDRGELFTYLSPGFAAGVISGGPFGVAQSPPWVSSTLCSPFAYTTCSGGLENPWGSTLGPPPSGNPADLVLPNAAAISTGLPLFSFADYNRANKLPYTMNETLDIQWQPRNDLAFDIGYVGNLGRHEIVPLPFNQAQIASPSNPIRPGTPFEQDYTYGYTIESAPGSFTPINLPNGQPYQSTFEGGNVDLRVPYIGYSSESESYTAAGVSDYNALQTHVEKRLSHGLQLGFSYTYSHSLDEQSAMGLFYNGNNPLNLRSGYGNSDFDRTHVINFTYLYELPSAFAANTVAGRFTSGWAVRGITVLQSGQPYSLVDYSGAIGSIYYGVNDGITNPIAPLAPGCTPQNALTGDSGAVPGFPAIKASCVGLPLLAPGALGGGIPSNDPYETNFFTGDQRNIFRQAWQKRADISIVKTTQVTERVAVKYSFDVYNLTNTPSFDIPIDNIEQNSSFNGFPYAGQPAATTPCDTTFTALYVCPSLSGLGITNKTIGSPRQIQMSLSVLF
jgi:Carboxypeptidase regulatory-like domain/TonB dependent receptor